MYTKTRATDENYSSGKHDAVIDGGLSPSYRWLISVQRAKQWFGSSLTAQHSNFKAQRLQQPSDTKGDGEQENGGEEEEDEKSKRKKTSIMGKRRRGKLRQKQIN
jgi:hypothetical protein